MISGMVEGSCASLTPQYGADGISLLPTLSQKLVEEATKAMYVPGALCAGFWYGA